MDIPEPRERPEWREDVNYVNDWASKRIHSPAQQSRQVETGANSLAIPKHTQYGTKTAREGSYSGWPDTASHTPQELAEAGFFYAGFGDCVRCFYCGIDLRQLTNDDNPWIEHARWSRNCVFVKQKKGEEFVNLVQLAVQYSQDKEAQSNSSGMKGVTDGSLNFRKMNVTFGPLPASLVMKSAEALNSVGALEGDRCTGTIFRVGRQYGMTAAHVIDSIINPHGLKRCDDLSQLAHCCVRFHDQERVFNLKPLLHFKDNELDVAIVEFIDRDIRRHHPPLQLVRYDVSSTLKTAAIIGYGNPEQPGKFLEPGVDVIQKHEIPKEEISEFLSQNKIALYTACCADSVETGYSGCDADTHMLLNCIMGPGASGSPVFTTEFQESLKVAGVFICGYPKMYYQFPESVQKEFPLKYTFEAATKTSAIYDAVCKQNKTKLAKAIFGC